MILSLLACALFQSGTMKIGSIELFGQSGLETAHFLKNLSVHPGDSYRWKNMAAVMQVIDEDVRREYGKPATDVAPVGFDENGAMIIFIGLPGPTVRKLLPRPWPHGSAKLDSEGLALYKSFGDTLLPALQRGGGREDDSQGYALFSDPELRAIQMRMRTYALAHDALIRKVLDTSTEALHRQAAAELLGYARHSKAQMDCLMRATADPDDTVRNNAVRAIGVLVKSDAKIAKSLPPTRFIAMVCSGTWTDRNKGSMVLQELSKWRKPLVLSEIRRTALPSLIEMARWRSGHSNDPRAILGRVAGIEEKPLQQMIERRDLAGILRAIAQLKAKALNQ